jgi:hypothetical protein
MDELNRVMAMPVKVRKQTIWGRTEIPPNAQNLIKAIGMRIPPKILRKRKCSGTEIFYASNTFNIN